MKPTFGYRPAFFLALLVPGAALLLAVDVERAELGLAIPPFGWPRFVVIHLLATLPFSVIVANRLAEPGRRSPGIQAAGAVGGAVLAGVTIAWGSGLAATLDHADAGFTTRLLVRSLWCAVLQVPWCLMGASNLTGATNAKASRAMVLMATAAALLLPAAYAEHWIRDETRQVEEALHRLRLVRAQAFVTGLCDLGSTRPVGGMMPIALRCEIARTLEHFAARVDQSLPADAPRRDRLEQARLCAMLGRLTRAEQVLGDMDQTDSEVLLLQAAVHQDAKRWDESSRCYRAALDQLRSLPSSTAVAAQVRAYDGLAFNARQRQEYTDVAVVYAEALARVDQAQAYFHYQLGRHHRDGGRPADALAHLQTAATLDPGGFAAKCRAMVNEIREHTPGCVLPRR